MIWLVEGIEGMYSCREYDLGGWGCALISIAGGSGGGWAVWQCNGTE